MRRQGVSVERGSSVSDFEPLEKAYQHSLRASLLHFETDGTRVHGIDTPGFKSADLLATELARLKLPAELLGKTVLDVGAWDGFFSFEAERRGAARVTVLDHYMWSLDIPAQQDYWRRCMAQGVAPRAYHETEYWHPEALPGKAGFDIARELRGSRVEAIVDDFMTTDLAALGRWDVVLYLGVLYHQENPMLALRRRRK